MPLTLPCVPHPQALHHFLHCPMTQYPEGEHIDKAIETVSTLIYTLLYNIPKKAKPRMNLLLTPGCSSCSITSPYGTDIVMQLEDIQLEDACLYQTRFVHYLLCIFQRNRLVFSYRLDRQSKNPLPTSSLTI